MRVLFMQPVQPEVEFLGRSRSLALVTNRIAPLGLGYLAAVCRLRGHEPAIYAPGDGGNRAQALERIREFKPRVIGISLTTPYFAPVKGFVELIKQRFPEIKIILGGHHATADPIGTLRLIPADLVIVGEGENTIVEVLDRVQGGDGFGGVKGAAWGRDGRAAVEAPRPLIEDVDSIPFPARDLFEPLHRYRPTPASFRRLPMGVVFTSRGCPYHCTFCDRSVFGNRFRARSPENVCEEIDCLIRVHGAREIRFFDDDFCFHKDRAIAICDEMRGRGFDVTWTCLMNANEADPELFRAMRRAGCWQALFGLESGSGRILRNLKKPMDLDMSERAIRLAHEAGLSVRADFLLGTPGETLDEMRQTVEFAVRNRVEYAHFNKFMPFPGTDIYRELVARGHEFDFTGNWSDLDHSAIVYRPEGVDPEQYSAVLDWSYRRFYLRPGYILRRLASIRSWAELKGQIGGAFAIFFLEGVFNPLGFLLKRLRGRGRGSGFGGRGPHDRLEAS